MATTTGDFEAIYKQCFPRAIGLARMLLHDEEDARDVVQEVFTRLIEDHGTILTPEAFLYRAVRNACINHIEKMSTRERIRRLLPLDVSEFSESTELSAIDERIQAVRTAAGHLLSKREGEVVGAIFADGQSYKEAARSLGVSTSAINKHIVNALRKLRQHFNSRLS